MGTSTEQLSRNIETTRENLARDVDELSDKVSPSRIVHRRKEAATSRLRGVRERVMGTAREAGDTLSSAAPDVKGSASEVAHTLEQRTQGNPLGAGLVAFGAGLVLSSLLPASSTETKAGGAALGAAKDHAQPLLDEAKSAGQDVADNLKESATEAAQDLGSAAKESAQHVKEAASTSADEVKQQASGG